MKWVSVNNTSAKEEFELWEDEQLLADISFSKQTRFVRMVSNICKRMFSFEKKGFLTQSKVIKNEYGIKLGKVEDMNPDTGKGIVEIEGKKYPFIYDKDNTGDLLLFDESMQKNLLSCNFKAIANTINKTNSFIDTKFASLLLLLCWYTFQPHNTQLQGLLSDANLIMK